MMAVVPPSSSCLMIIFVSFANEIGFCSKVFIYRPIFALPWASLYFFKMSYTRVIQEVMRTHP